MRIGALVWWLALAAFAGLGLLRWGQSIEPRFPNLGRADAGLDAIARTHFALADGAAVIRQELSALPPDAPLLVVGPGKDWTLTEAHYLISYLAWPRPVWSLGMVPPGQKAPFDHPPPPGYQPAAIFFYKIGAPPGLAAHPLSERLSVGVPAP